MTIALWTAAAFVSGSLMFSYWLGLATRRNLTRVGDGNPGALNLWRSAGVGYGLAGIALDFLKGFVPVWAFARTVPSAPLAGLVAVAAAPVLGHAFSPFLRGRGGKAIAVTFGVWSGLTGFAASLAYAVILAVLKAAGRFMNKGRVSSAEADALQVVLGMLLLTIGLLAVGGAPALPSFGAANLLLLVFTHRKELRSLLRTRAERQRNR